MIARCAHCPIAPGKICVALPLICEAIRDDADKRDLFMVLAAEAECPPEFEDPPSEVHGPWQAPIRKPCGGC